MKKRPILIDTNLLSIFAELKKLNLLLILLTGHQLYISPAIWDELAVGLSLGHYFLQDVFDLVGDSQPIGISSLQKNEAKRLKTLPSWLGLGEAECFVVCKNRGWIFASNDGKAVRYCKHQGILCITLNDILAALWRGGIVTKDDVGEIIRQLEASGRKMKAKDKILK